MRIFGRVWQLCAALICCVLLSGCMTPWLKARYETADAAQGLVTPVIIADCSAKVQKAFPNLTIAGPFALNGYAAARVASSKLSLEAVPEKNLVALVARTTNKNLFGQENRGHAGCSYYVENGRLVFQDVHGIATFMPPTVYVPVR
ncbi:MAG: hypothetical protein J0G36_21930 [Afipia sp.]|nr:hypothetical protein [Afipia sp.]